MMNSQNPGAQTLQVKGGENTFTGEKEPYFFLGPRRCGSQDCLSITNTISLVLLAATVYLILRGFWCMQELSMYRPLHGGNYARLLSTSRARLIMACVEESSMEDVRARRPSTNSTSNAPVLEAPAARLSTAASQRLDMNCLYIKEASSQGVAKTLLTPPVEEAELRRQRKALDLSCKDFKNLQYAEIQIILKARNGIKEMISDKHRAWATLGKLAKEWKQLESLEAKLAKEVGGNSSTELEETNRRIQALEKQMQALHVTLRRIRSTMYSITQQKLQKALSLKLFLRHRIQNQKISITAANALSIATLVVNGVSGRNCALPPNYSDEALKVAEEFLTSTQSATEDLLEQLNSPTNGLKTIRKSVAKCHLLQKDASMYALQMRSALMAPSARRIIERLESQNFKLSKALEKAHGILQKGTTEGAARASQGSPFTRGPFSLLRKLLGARRSTGLDKSR